MAAEVRGFGSTGPGDGSPPLKSGDRIAQQRLAGSPPLRSASLALGRHFGRRV